MNVVTILFSNLMQITCVTTEKTKMHILQPQALKKLKVKATHVIYKISLTRQLPVLTGSIVSLKFSMEKGAVMKRMLCRPLGSYVSIASRD